eukprot:5847006-Pyramimonas_sp.AAC.2
MLWVAQALTRAALFNITGVTLQHTQVTRGAVLYSDIYSDIHGGVSVGAASGGLRSSATSLYHRAAMVARVRVVNALSPHPIGPSCKYMLPPYIRLVRAASICSLPTSDWSAFVCARMRSMNATAPRFSLRLHRANVFAPVVCAVFTRPSTKSAPPKHFND